MLLRSKLCLKMPDKNIKSGQTIQCFSVSSVSVVCCWICVLERADQFCIEMGVNGSPGWPGGMTLFQQTIPPSTSCSSQKSRSYLGNLLSPLQHLLKPSDLARVPQTVSDPQILSPSLLSPPWTRLPCLLPGPQHQIPHQTILSLTFRPTLLFGNQGCCFYRQTSKHSSVLLEIQQRVSTVLGVRSAVWAMASEDPERLLPL